MAPAPATAVGSHLYVRHGSHLYVRGGVTWPLLLPLQWGLLGCQRLHLGSLGVHLICSLTYMCSYLYVRGGMTWPLLLLLQWVLTYMCVMTLTYMCGEG
jgi:hypothetical protein